MCDEDQFWNIKMLSALHFQVSCCLLPQVARTVWDTGVYIILKSSIEKWFFFSLLQLKKQEVSTLGFSVFQEALFFPQGLRSHLLNFRSLDFSAKISRRGECQGLLKTNSIFQLQRQSYDDKMVIHRINNFIPIKIVQMLGYWLWPIAQPFFKVKPYA